MAARVVLGAVCRRLWQAGTGQAGGTGRANRGSCYSVLLPAVVLTASRDFSVNSSKSSTSKNGGFLLTSMKWVQFSNLHVDVPKDLTKPAITISDEPDTLYKRLSVLVKGHDKAVLDSYEYFAVLAAKELGISIEVHEPPRKIERFTLLKSVHIFKKHRVQYEMRTLYRCFELKHLTGSTADVYLEYIQRNLPEGVAMEVTKTKLERLPEHIKEPIWERIPEGREESKS
ncbi:28S ribosomal protein S10, mitochondrial isoform X2 [Phyllostomus hastatus]|uniref:28S ribosomal protein S10, mitochondrial isoform X2 n=1 Tax=Phyllostomus hastatus TaxID=9423 RepID=UPI001E685B1B|nr:28S ribosomal protein S10, mitochondrial isoform X2 [Phyllostomus hastatus]